MNKRREDDAYIHLQVARAVRSANEHTRFKRARGTQSAHLLRYVYKGKGAEGRAAGRGRPRRMRASIQVQRRAGNNQVCGTLAYDRYSGITRLVLQGVPTCRRTTTADCTNRHPSQHGTVGNLRAVFLSKPGPSFIVSIVPPLPDSAHQCGAPKQCLSQG